VAAYRDPSGLRFTKLLALPFVEQKDAWLLPDGSRPKRLT
jgi:hypothetical protein